MHSLVNELEQSGEFDLVLFDLRCWVTDAAGR